MSFGLSRGKTLVTEGFGLALADLPAFDLDDPASSRVDPREWFEHPAHPFEIGKDQPVRLSASAGIASFPKDGDSHDQVLQHADDAMYRAKSQGKNAVVCYSDIKESPLEAQPASD